MPSPTAVQALVQALIPATRTDDALRRELVEHSQDILSSHIGRPKETDIAHLGGIVKRQLLQSPTGSPAIAAQRFTNLLSRLLEQDVITQKHGVLLFLHSLASSNNSTAAPMLSLPSLLVPPPATPTIRSPLNGRASPSPIIERPVRPNAVKSKAELLREFRAKTGKSHVPEHLLVRDSLYLLQGISGKYIHFVNAPNIEGEEAKTVLFKEPSKHIVSSSTRELIILLSEIGYLYTRIQAFVQAVEGQPSVGLIKQSLCHHLQSQLTEYYRMVAVLESQMASTDAADTAQRLDTGLTLRRLELWTEEWRLRMRMMSVCVEGCKDAQGGALVSLIHTYTDNGDPFVRDFTDQLLEEVSKPFFVTLHRWIYSGDLHDPFLEFFVAVNPNLAHRQYTSVNTSFDLEDMHGRDSGASLWKSKYQFRKGMIPRFVGEDFGRKIFSTGKSLNFIRYSCQDSEWVATRHKLSNAGKVLKYSDIAGLERSIDSAYQVASQRLYDVFFDKFKLMDHLAALKNYILLGHGDFAENLMETMAGYLSKPANNLQRHKLTSSLETAIRSTNAQFDPPDVLRRLDARMLEFTHGEIGWEVFTLEYKLDSPIDTVLDPESMKKYLRLFGHLWKMKRVDSALAACWMKVMSSHKLFQQIPDLASKWHQVRIAMSEMIFFIRQLQTYAQLVVIESSWRKLSEFLKKKEGDLDSLIQAHQEYLTQMLNRVLLLKNRPGKEEAILAHVKEAFDFILQFVEAVDGLYNHSLNEASRLDSARDEQRGVHTAHNGRRTPDPADSLSRTLRRIREYSGEFSARALSIVIGVQSHDDTECKVLGQILAFSDFYANKRHKQKEEATVSSIER